MLPPRVRTQMEARVKDACDEHERNFALDALHQAEHWAEIFSELGAKKAKYGLLTKEDQRMYDNLTPQMEYYASWEKELRDKP